MRQALSKGMLTAAAATSILSLPGGYAFASGAEGTTAGSPGVASGNLVQAPIDVPVNVCGNTADVAALANSAGDNGCGSGAAATTASRGATSADRAAGPHDKMPAPALSGVPGSGPQLGHPAVPVPQQRSQSMPRQAEAPADGASADGTASGSPGVASGNTVQAPVDVPVNACGNTVNVIALLNPAAGNGCAKGDAASTAAGEGAAEEADAPADAAADADVAEDVDAPAVSRLTPPRTAPERHQGTTSTAISGVPRARSGVATPAVDAASLQTSQDGALAETGADENLPGAAAIAAALLIGGAVLYRRGATASRRG